ncbi:hypothetical protein CSOJ01_07416 [Colletotrichum sojae]|uniref:CCD97-like C-terminal domain-containing protein n=1 Tax=Colletotrichum sojae TaxID=2175907 RepID=A0A8H6J9T9_9PEZI|nr:hypothetical protein CSOJ01_07416 [Colletotrichum sojae]
MPSLNNTQPPPYDKPAPRPPKSKEKTRDIRLHNRRREFLLRNPDYLKSSEHELADPFLYDTLVRRFQTPAEREVDGRSKGYSRVLEGSLLRGEARLADLAQSATNGDRVAATSNTAKDFAAFTTEAGLPKAETKEEGIERWHGFVAERFVHGYDEDFDYEPVDNNEEYDAMEMRDAEDAWFDAEDPSWASDADNDFHAVDSNKPKQGQTGVQDF